MITGTVLQITDRAANTHRLSDLSDIIATLIEQSGQFKFLLLSTDSLNDINRIIEIIEENEIVAIATDDDIDLEEVDPKLLQIIEKNDIVTIQVSTSDLGGILDYTQFLFREEPELLQADNIFNSTSLNILRASNSELDDNKLDQLVEKCLEFVVVKGERFCIYHIQKDELYSTRNIVRFIQNCGVSVLVLEAKTQTDLIEELEDELIHLPVKILLLDSDFNLKEME